MGDAIGVYSYLMEKSRDVGARHISLVHSDKSQVESR